MNINSKKKSKSIIMITDEAGISPIKALLTKKKNIKINIQNNNERDKTISLRLNIASIQKICFLINKEMEEQIVLKSAKTNFYTKNDHNDIEDSFEINYNCSQKPSIIDTSDLKGDEQFELPMDNNNHNKDTDNIENDYFNGNDNNSGNKNICQSNENLIEEGILRKLYPTNFISRHYESMLIVWEILYCIMILSGINILVHLFILIVNLQLFNSFYIFYAGVLGCMLLYLGISCLSCFVADKPKDVYSEYTNFGLIIAGIMTFGVWVIIPGLPVKEKYYCQTETWYSLLYSIGVISEVGALIVNFSMENFYREYSSLIPYQYIVLSDP